MFLKYHITQSIMWDEHNAQPKSALDWWSIVVRPYHFHEVLASTTVKKLWRTIDSRQLFLKLLGKQSRLQEGGEGQMTEQQRHTQCELTPDDKCSFVASKGASQETALEI